MSDDITAIIIVAIAVLGPIWLTFQFVGRRNATRQLNAQDAAVMDQMSQSMARMEDRIATLEQILDGEVPGWRTQQPNLYRKVS